MWNLKRRKQNHKISFHFFAGSPHPPRRKWIGKEIFGFGLRPKGERGALHSLHHAIGAYDLGSSHHALGACVSHQNPADFARTLFELRPKNTARHCTNGTLKCFTIENELRIYCLKDFIISPLLVVRVPILLP